ncbi:spliceosome associated protein [Ephemerocybe angulata]|uniref:Spliceosome associated protein n=1 Tax=Ephemerocybe angulata TaxID=980116 RepID=A0A8H6IDH4_9AGAR|nr:spliceosome associated protein [Tulosesus angulatus]
MASVQTEPINAAALRELAGGKAIKSKNQLRRLKQKQKKVVAASVEPTPEPNGNDNQEDSKMEVDEKPSVMQELLAMDDIDFKAAGLEAFADVFARFQLPSESSSIKQEGDLGKGEVIYSDDEQASEDSDSDSAPKPLSKKKARKLNRLTVAELKQLVKKPEIVEWTDITASDPRLLLHLKSHRNTVPIPIHWSAKRDYLQGKRGIEKPPFQLPAFIADTGIATMRDAVKEKEATMSLKAKTRERVQPKMGKIDIDYQKLHDAFFKFQTKPPMTEFGEMYYEGKEFETSLKEKKPGDLSPELVEALSIPPLAPPPWLISMQRFGPPPSYPTLRIPGLNAPIPEGAQWGFHPGGWGKPPLDEYNRPLYGDVFGVLPKASNGEGGQPINKEPWGELEPEEEEEEESSEEEEESDEEMGEPAPAEGLQTPSGLETPSGMASVVSTVAGGLETPDFIELRKARERTSEEPSAGPRSLYHVVPERQTNVRGLMGSERGYDVSAVAQATNIPVLGEDGRPKKKGGVEVTLDASELEGMSEDDLRKKYDSANKGNAGVPGGGRSEDFSDLVAKEMAKKKQKMDRDRERDRDKKKESFKF